MVRAGCDNPSSAALEEMTINLGQAFGIQQLRIWELEDELEALGREAGRKVRNAGPAERRPATREVPVVCARLVTPQIAPPTGRGIRRGVGRRVFDALPDHPPGDTISEIMAYLGDVNPSTVSAFLCLLEGVLRTGEPRRFRYYRKAAA